jgi:hypothetical protein
MTTHEQFCLDTATHFSAARGRGFNRTTQKFDTMAEAKEYAATFGDGRTMIYAINAMDNCAHICNA